MKTEKEWEKVIRDVLGEYDLVRNEIDGITKSILERLNEEETFREWIERMNQMRENSRDRPDPIARTITVITHQNFECHQEDSHNHIDNCPTCQEIEWGPENDPE